MYKLSYFMIVVIYGMIFYWALFAASVAEAAAVAGAGARRTHHSNYFFRFAFFYTGRVQEYKTPINKII